MIQELVYTLRVIWACMKKDIKSELTDRAFTLVGITTPVNAFLLMSLFVLGSSSAPTAVVMKDTGPYAQQFFQSMSNVHSFRLQQASASEAATLLQAGRIVAIVTIPPEFDQSIRQNEAVKVNVQINNLNTDFTNDIQRAIPTSITSFYSHAFPDVVTVVPRESNVYPNDTSYMQYLTVSILVVGMLMGGVVQAGTAAASEWERETIKEILLSPAGRWSIVVGKMLSSFVINLASLALVLTVLIFVLGVWPKHWGEVIGFSVLCNIIFIGWGTFLGTILKQRKVVVAIAMGITIPLFFLSAPFGPLAFNSQAIQIIAQVFPIYYAIVLLQHAFHDFNLNMYGVSINALILCGYTLLMILLAAFALRRSTVAH